MNGTKHLIIKLSSRSEGSARGFLSTQSLEGAASTALWSGSLRRDDEGVNDSHDTERTGIEGKRRAWPRGRNCAWERVKFTTRVKIYSHVITHRY